MFILLIFSDSNYGNRSVKEIIMLGVSGLLGSIAPYLVNTASIVYLNTNGWISKFYGISSFVLTYLFRAKFALPSVN